MFWHLNYSTQQANPKIYIFRKPMIFRVIGMSTKVQELFKGDLEIRAALLSVYDKTGLVQFAKFLADYNVRLISTGGTFTEIRNAGIPVIQVADVTDFPEMLDGRVKTLHPKISGGFLANKANPEHMAALKTNGISTIDMVVCTFYPFEQVAAKMNVTLEDLLEQVDIGGPTMVISGVKNFGSVCVVPRISHYPEVMAAMKANQGKVPFPLRAKLAAAGADAVAEYRSLIRTNISPRLAALAGTQPAPAAPKIKCLHGC
jgi:phosphoribosylaminoimidazolecarboxamide formyltransferase/IMP cyclohydrolase